jgi:hypothetical protein
VSINDFGKAWPKLIFPLFNAMANAAIAIEYGRT